MSVLEEIRTKAKALHRTVILPEGNEDRTLKAARMLIDGGLADVILVEDEASIHTNASRLGVDLGGIQIVDPKTSPKAAEFATLIYEKRKAKGMTPEKAAELSADPIYFATCMLETGMAHALVTGALHTTGDMLRPALQIIGTAPGNKTVSSMFLMVMPDGKLLGFGDCAVIPDPTADQLSDIALATAKTFKTLTGIEPAVAMLSFSTKGSAEHDMVTKVREATSLAHQKAPELALDGELQFDAAYVPSVGERKAPGSPVAGKANVFIFPDLNAGNIGYKMVQRLAGAQAIGPVSQGLAKPANDLSRGCSAEDIRDVCCIALLNA
ncbi:MAG: phosphate acetyltransferase [Candidatus Cryosericum sp.]